MSRRPRTGTNITTIAEVAKKAGVSPQTVSRALLSRPRISPVTRQRVLDVVAELGYLPNQNARSLASTRSNLVGLITHALPESGPTQVLVSFEEAAKQRGYNVIVADVDGNINAIREAVEQMRSYNVAGIQINVPLRIDFRFVKTVPRRIPFVLHDVTIGKEIGSVSFDHEKAAKLLTDHLIGLGHTKIAFVGGPQTWIAERLRQQGWKRALAKAGLNPGPLLAGDWSAVSGYDLGQQLLTQRDRFSAVIAGSELMAIGILRAFHERDIHAPKDVSIASFGDSPFASYLSPALTAIHQDFIQVGLAGFECLINLAENPDSLPKQIRLDPELVVRESTSIFKSRRQRK